MKYGSLQPTKYLKTTPIRKRIKLILGVTLTSPIKKWIKFDLPEFASDVNTIAYQYRISEQSRKPSRVCKSRVGFPLGYEVSISSLLAPTL